jgi:hypothetical protein
LLKSQLPSPLSKEPNPPSPVKPDKSPPRPLVPSLEGGLASDAGTSALVLSVPEDPAPAPALGDADGEEEDPISIPGIEPELDEEPSPLESGDGLLGAAAGVSLLGGALWRKLIS